jgi:membrane associated rhomboid family serine protease
MIPLVNVDRKPTRVPIMTGLIIVVNLVVFFLELAGGEDFVNRWSLIPSHIMAGHDLITLLTSMFLHAGWEHILGNMLFLHVFGPCVEDVMGPVNYLAFYLFGGLVANFAQILVAPGSEIPSLGASGAIAAVMGAFIVSFPRDRIKTVTILGRFVNVTLIPAVVLLGFWFVLQLFSQVGSIADVQNGGVAYMAHIGGFLYGAIAGRWFEHRAEIDQARAIE